MTPQIYLRKGKEESLMRRHPWIFSGAIDYIKAEDESEIAEGALVEVYTRSGEFIAQGHYQIGSIAVRVLSFCRETIDQEWWNRRIAVAHDVRRTLGLTDNPDTNCYRLVHGEGDALPGLVVDIYGTAAVVQCHSVGMYHARMEIAKAIRATYGDKITAIYDKSSQTVPFNARLGAVDGYLWGSSDHESHIVTENGEKFLVNWEKGQKTGFFLDQRENRELVKRYAKGRTVLNTFCYTGGFSVYAMAGGARKVCSVDSSERAVTLATENMVLNFGREADFCEIAADAVEYLKDIGDKYDLIILDEMMPGMTGMDAAREIRSFDAAADIIFLTTSPGFAYESYGVRAAEYLLKPINAKLLYPVLDKLYLRDQKPQDGLTVKSNGMLVRLPFSQLSYVEVNGKHLFFNMADGTVHEVAASMREYEGALLARPEFMRVHRSYIVNMLQAEKLSPAGVITFSGHNVPVSRLLYGQLQKDYLALLFSGRDA